MSAAGEIVTNERILGAENIRRDPVNHVTSPVTVAVARALGKHRLADSVLNKS